VRLQSTLVSHGFSQVECKREYISHFKNINAAPVSTAGDVAESEDAIRSEVDAYNAKQLHSSKKLPDAAADDLIAELHASGVKNMTGADWVNTPGKSINITDRDKGLPGARQDQFPHSLNLACVHHVEANVIKHSGAIPPGAIWDIQSAKTKVEGDTKYEALAKNHPKAVAYLKNIDPALWMAWPHLHTTSLREYKTSNAAEGQNSVLTPEARQLCPLESTHSVCKSVMTSLSAKRAAALLRFQKGELLTTYAQNKYNEQDRQSSFYTVQQSTATRFFVACSTGTDQKTHEIDLDNTTCSGCSFWFQFKIPCCHAIAAARAGGWLGPRYSAWLNLAVDPGYKMIRYTAVLLQASVRLPDRGSLVADGGGGGGGGDGGGAGVAGGQSNQNEASYAAAHAAAEAAAEAGGGSKGMADAYEAARESGAGESSAGSGSGLVDFTPQAQYTATFDGKFNTKADLGITWAIDAPASGQLVVAVAGFTSGAGAGGPVGIGDRLVAFGDIESGHALLLDDLLGSAEPSMQIEALFAVTMGLKHPVTLTFARAGVLPALAASQASGALPTLPNDPVAQPGRPSKKRIRHQSEQTIGGMRQGAQSKPRNYKCSRCHSTEHTTKRCKHKFLPGGGGGAQ
jgi:hypothetical protein